MTEKHLLVHVSFLVVCVHFEIGRKNPLFHIRVSFVHRFAEPSACDPAWHVFHQLVLLVTVASQLPHDQAVGLRLQQRLQRCATLVVLEQMSPSNKKVPTRKLILLILNSFRHIC